VGKHQQNQIMLHVTLQVSAYMYNVSKAVAEEVGRIGCDYRFGRVQNVHNVS
jgi:hypothetical protein